MRAELIDLIHVVREGVKAGEDDATLVGRLRPRVDRLVESARETPAPARTQTPEARRQAAAVLGRQGGKARAAKLTAKRRTEIARRAAAARWSKER